MNTTYKRQHRELSQETKKKISVANKRPKTAIHKMHISQAMQEYWKTVPSRKDSEDTTTYQEGGII